MRYVPAAGVRSGSHPSFRIAGAGAAPVVAAFARTRAPSQPPLRGLRLPRAAACAESALRQITDEIMLELCVLSGQDYVSTYGKRNDVVEAVAAEPAHLVSVEGRAAARDNPAVLAV